MSDKPLDVYVLYSTDTEQKFIKVADDGCLAIFEDEASAKLAKRWTPGTDYRQVNYYSQKQVDQMQAENEALRARVAELKKMMEAIKAAAGYRWMNGISDHKLLSDIEKLADNAAHPTDSGQGGDS